MLVSFTLKTEKTNKIEDNSIDSSDIGTIIKVLFFRAAVLMVFLKIEKSNKIEGKSNENCDIKVLTFRAAVLVPWKPEEGQDCCEERFSQQLQ